MLYGAGRVLHGAGKVYHGAKKVSNGANGIPFCPFLSVLVLVLLSAHVKRFSVPHMQKKRKLAGLFL